MYGRQEMSEEKEKKKQGKGSLSDSIEMFDTLFRVELTGEKQGEEEPNAEESPLSDSEELFVSAFKEDIPAEKPMPRVEKKGPARKPPREPAGPPRSSAPATAQAQPPGVSSSPPFGRTPAASQENRLLPQKAARSFRKPLKILVPVLGVVVLAGAVLFAWGVPDFFSDRGKPQSSARPVTKELPPPPPPPKPVAKEEPRPVSPPPEAVTQEEPGRLFAPPKSQGQEERRPQPSAPSTPKKPGIREAELPKERPAAEVAVKKPDAAPPEQKAVLPKPPSLPYSVFLGSFKDQEGVQKAVSVFQKTGLSPYWFPLDLGEKGVWYRVFAGCFRTREEAEAFIQEKRIPDASSRQTPHAALAGVYRTREELDPLVSRLTKLGYGPYVIRHENGPSHLYVGAFFQKGQAEALVAELAGKGIESRPAER
jgi:hypothetical protein